MYRKIISLFMCLIFIMPLVVRAEESVPTSLEAPKSFNAYMDGSTVKLRWTEDQSISDLIRKGVTKVLFEIDWKLNNGQWAFGEKEWGETDKGLKFMDRSIGSFHGYPGNLQHDVNNVTWTWYSLNSFKLKEKDLQSNTLYFRVRYIYEYKKDRKVAHVSSPYSSIASVGKSNQIKLPVTLEAPKNLKAELKTRNDGAPYFDVSWDIPDSISQLNRIIPVWHVLDWKVSNGKWASESKGRIYEGGSMLLDCKQIVNPLDRGGIGKVDIKANTYYFRVLFNYRNNKERVKSPFSNICSVGTPDYYRGASSWADSELKKATGYGLITDKIKDNMSGPVSREEFSEIVVKLYEKVTGKQASYKNINTFTDTKNEEVVKAFELGIVKGVGNNKFAPSELVTREQIATMMYRAVKTMRPDADFSTNGVGKFPDEKSIASYALEPIKFMSKNGFMKGGSGGSINPKGNTTREQAVIMAVRTLEKYKK